MTIAWRKAGAIRPVLPVSFVLATLTFGACADTGIGFETGVSFDSGIGKDTGVVFPDSGPDTGGGGSGPSGFWHFDDCSSISPFLVDATGNGANAQHALGRKCAPGISGQ